MARVGVSEAETAETIAAARAETGDAAVPAFGDRLCGSAEDHAGTVPMITLATAHPAKFPDAVEAASGIRPALPARMADLFDRPERLTRVPEDLAAIEALVEERRGQ